MHAVSRCIFAAVPAYRHLLDSVAIVGIVSRLQQQVRYRLLGDLCQACPVRSSSTGVKQRRLQCRQWCHAHWAYQVRIVRAEACVNQCLPLGHLVGGGHGPSAIAFTCNPGVARTQSPPAAATTLAQLHRSIPSAVSQQGCTNLLNVLSAICNWCDARDTTIGNTSCLSSDTSTWGGKQGGAPSGC
jgi:hypothetical protein